MADEIDTRQAIAAAKEAFNTFSQSGKEYRMDACSGCMMPLPSEWTNSLTRRFWNTALRKTARRLEQPRATFSCTSKKFSRTSIWQELSDFQSRHGTGGRGGHIYALEFERRFDRDQGGSGNRCGMHGRYQAQRDERDATEVLMDAFHEPVCLLALSIS